MSIGSSHCAGEVHSKSVAQCCDPNTRSWMWDDRPLAELFPKDCTSWESHYQKLRPTHQQIHELQAF